MRIEKAEAIVVLAPILESMSRWWLDAMRRFELVAPTPDDRLDIGTIVRAGMIQRFALANMRCDPAVAGNFRPIECEGLEALVLTGDDGSPNITVLLNKATNDYLGTLRIAPNSTQRRSQRCNGEYLAFPDLETIPLVCFYELRATAELLEPRIARIGLAEESGSGFSWVHYLWSEAEGDSLTAIQSEPPLFPAPRIRLRKPDIAQQNERTVGTHQEDARQRRDANRPNDERESSGGA